jgi:hypothetical protein
MKSAIQRYYDSEKNATISWFWDGGFYIHIGDYINGFKHPEFIVTTWEEVEKVFEEELKK